MRTKEIPHEKVTLETIEAHLTRQDEEMKKGASKAEYFALIGVSVGIIILGLSTFSTSKDWLDLVVVAVGVAGTFWGANRVIKIDRPSF